MEKFKWTTDSCWIDETFDIFKSIDNDFDIEALRQKIRNGEIWGERKSTSAIRVFEAIKARYLKHDREKVIALSSVLNSNITKQEKYNHLLIYFLEYETLVEFLMSNYICDNFNKYSQKIYTSMDLDRFFEIILNDYTSYLPEKLQEGISDKSMNKARNQLWKNIETFGWGEKRENKLIVKRPNLTPEWIVYTLYFYFPDENISIKDIYKSDVYKRFLLNEVDLDFLINGAKIKGLIEVQSLGDISTVTRKEGGLLDYANNYK